MDYSEHRVRESRGTGTANLGNTRPDSVPEGLSFQKMSKSRNWCFTLNNPEQDLSLLKNNLLVKTLIYNLELGEEELTLHYQGYIELCQPRALTYLKQLIPRAHFEPRKGTRQQAIWYCLKDLESTFGITRCGNSITDTTPRSSESWKSMTISEAEALGAHIFVRGEDFVDLNALEDWTSEVKKTNVDDRLISIQSQIKRGASDLDLTEFDFPIWVKYHKQLSHYRMLIQPKRANVDMKVIVIMEPTGTGKSKWAMENYPTAFWKQRSNWWDGYAGEETVIVDEFYGWLPFDTLLRLCDRYPMKVETKGGQVEFTSSTLIFTTNQYPDLWYKKAYFPALERRVSEWHVMNSLRDHQIFKKYENAKAMYLPANSSWDE